MKSVKKICLVLILSAVFAATVFALAFFTGCNAETGNPNTDTTVPDGTQNGDGNDNQGGEEKPDKPDKPVLTDPAIHGAEDVEIEAGKFCDFMYGITATSSSGDDITALIEVTGEVNTSKAGEYTLTYSVTDSYGKTATAERKVTVTENPYIGEEKPVPVYKTDNAYNIAAGCTAVATATSNGSAQKALDGNLSSRWESDHGEDDVNLTLDLGAILPVEGIVIDWEAAYATDFEILISSDGTEYTKVAGVEGQILTKDEDGRLKNSFALEKGTSARFVRLHCTARKTTYGYSVYEFEVYGTQGTVIPEKEFPVLYSAAQSGSPDWAIEDEQWLLINFGEVKSFDYFEISWSNWQSPFAYEILLSDTVKFENAKTVSLDGQKIVDGTNKNATVSAQYVKIAMHKRKFTAQGYLINQLTFRLGTTQIQSSSYTVTASSERDGHGANNAKNDYGTYWASAYGADADLLDFKTFPDSNRKDGEFAAKKIDLGEVRDIGRVDLYWNNSDGGKGKYYDLQISEDGTRWSTVFRQNHGDTRLQSVYVYETARYLRVIDYQNTSGQAFMLEGIVVNSQYPENIESKIHYDIDLSFPAREVINTENGSYITGGTDFPTSRLVAYLDDSLRDKPIPSNDWWQGLLINDKGYNMFMNPLMTAFKNDGLWVTSPGEGYFSGFVPGNGSQTVNVDSHDLRIGYAGMGADAEVRVKGYSDYGISAVMTDNKNVDKLTVFLSEGALYTYCLFAEPEKATVWSENLIAVYDLQGNEILDSRNSIYTGDCIIICVRAHSGYTGGIQKYKDASGEHINPKEYEERYYIVNVPEDTQFKRGESVISAVMTNGNYMSVGAMSASSTAKVAEAQSKDTSVHGTFEREEALLMHEHGYAFVVGTFVDYDFDEITNKVTTYFRVTTMCVRSGYSNEAYVAYLPHHLSKSDYEGGYVYKSIRGDCRSFVGNLFVTEDYFQGIVPTFSEPDDDGYSADVLYKQLVLLYENNGGSKAPENSNLISGDPYWQGKNLHPMAMAALAADQIGAFDLRDAFLDKIEYILTDWFTYDEIADASTGAYFYYDSEWGTLYYKNSEFGAGVNLADHYFTYGYYTLASGILCAYRPAFAEKFGDMIELLIRDYMNWQRDDELFPYMRNFDMFAGHGWAGGYADNNGGNNQESAGEALNSWVGAYLYATAVRNEDIRIAAIYGYTTELNAIKHYWFNYFNDFAESYQYGVAGQVYGGSNFYGTFFNGEPLFMYGIHLIPGEEYLTSYALNESEREKLESLIDNMRKEQAMWEVEESHKKIYAWQHIFIPIVAIYDADEAIEWYEQTLAEQGNVGNTSEQYNVYWLIHGMKSTGVRTTDIWAENGASASVYKLGNEYKAVCWNPTPEVRRINFRNADGVVGSAFVPACSLVTVDPTTVTETFETFTDSSSVTVDGYADIKNASQDNGSVSFANNGSVKYLLSCGTQENYCKIVLTGTLQNAQLLIDGVPCELIKTSDGYETSPLVLTFKHEFEIRANGGTLSGIEFVDLELQKIDITGATATASSNNGPNVAQNAVDGKEGSRWESVHNSDDEWIIVELPEAVTVYQLQILWEAASAAEYNVYFSMTGDEDDWTRIYHGEYSQGARRDIVAPDIIAQARYIKIEGVRRSMPYGYSIYEIEFYGL